MTNSTTTLYGIPNCDTVRKARRWLDAANIAYTWQDFREQPVAREQLQSWFDQLGWQTVINKRSTIWKNLSEQARADINAETALQLAAENPTLIKRPVLSHQDHLTVGFKAETYAEIFTT